MLRWTRDEKGIKDRQTLASVTVQAPLPPFRTDETTFEEVTGRFGFDWKPGWGDDSTIYAFYSRGYKAGGFNPPLDRTNPAFAGTPEVYDPEFIDALEIGTKNLFANGRVQANLTAFYYDYKDLQVSKIIARTSVNENIKSNIYGLEGEFVFSPTDAFVVDMNVAYLKTEIKDTQSIDPRDISGGNPNVTVLKDVDQRVELRDTDRGAWEPHARRVACCRTRSSDCFRPLRALLRPRSSASTTVLPPTSRVTSYRAVLSSPRNSARNTRSASASTGSRHERTTTGGTTSTRASSIGRSTRSNRGT